MNLEQIIKLAQDGDAYAVDELCTRLVKALEVMEALGDAYDVGQPAGDTSAIGRYREIMKKWE